MKSLVFNGPWSLTVEERPAPAMSEREALLRIVATGICGSDLHGFTGENGRRHPGQVMGHETVATVVDDPSGTYSSGDLVTVNPVIGCGHCADCQQGEPQRCPQRRVIGVTRELSSAFAELMVAPLTNLVALPDGVPPEIGGLVEPLSVGFHAAGRGAVTERDAVLVIGGGPIGQAAALAARRLGSPAVVVSEPDAYRRRLCERLGFTTLDPADDPSALSERVSELLGAKPGVVLDAVGLSATLRTACEVSALGARIVLVGMNSREIQLPAYPVSTDERSIIGSFCYNASEFAETAEWTAANASELVDLIDRRVPLADAPETFARLSRGELQASKVMVYLNAEAPSAPGDAP